MESIFSADRSLEARRKVYPERKAKIGAMVAIIEKAGAISGGSEQRIIEQMRPMGHEGLPSWARRQQPKRKTSTTYPDPPR